MPHQFMYRCVEFREGCPRPVTSTPTRSLASWPMSRGWDAVFVAMLQVRREAVVL